MKKDTNTVITIIYYYIIGGKAMVVSTAAYGDEHLGYLEKMAF